MRKKAERGFMLIRATNWELSFFCKLHHFQNRNLWYIFQMLFAQNIWPCIPLLFI